MCGPFVSSDHVIHTLIFTGGELPFNKKWILGNFQTRESGSQYYQFISGIWCLLAFHRIDSSRFRLEIPVLAC